MDKPEDGPLPSIVLIGEINTIIKKIIKFGDGYNHDPEYLADQRLEVISRLKRLARAIQARGD